MVRENVYSKFTLAGKVKNRDEVHRPLERYLPSGYEVIGGLGGGGDGPTAPAPIFSVPTIADLRAIDRDLLVDGQVVDVISYWANITVGLSSTFKGSGSFVWMENSTLTVDHGTVFDLDDGHDGRFIRIFYEFLDVTMFGGKVDGSSDDTGPYLKLRDAADAKQLPVLIPPGRSILSNKIEFATSLPVIGRGRGLSRLCWPAGVNEDHIGFEIPIVSRDFDRVTVSGISFERSGGDQGDAIGTALRIIGDFDTGFVGQQVSLFDLHAGVADGSLNTEGFAIGFDLKEIYGASVTGVSFLGVIGLTDDDPDTTNNLGIGLYYHSEAGGNSNGLHINDMRVGRAEVAVDLFETEGAKIERFEFVACNIGVRHDVETALDNQPGLTIGPGHMNCYTQGVYAISASQFLLTGLEIYRRADAVGNYQSIRLEDCFLGRIVNNNFSDAGSSKLATHIQIDELSSVILCDGNVHQAGAVAYRVQPGATDITIGNRTFGPGAPDRILFSGADIGEVVVTPKGGLRFIHADVDFEFLPIHHSEYLIYDGTLTANRHITLKIDDAYDGMRIRVDRTGPGAFNLDCFALIVLDQNEWAEFAWNGTVLVLEDNGTLIDAGFLPSIAGFDYIVKDGIYLRKDDAFLIKATEE